MFLTIFLKMENNKNMTLLADREEIWWKDDRTL